MPQRASPPPWSIPDCLLQISIGPARPHRTYRMRCIRKMPPPAVTKIACGAADSSNAKLCPSETVTIWEGRRRLRMWNFRRPGENGMERTPSDAAAILFFLRKEREKMGRKKCGRPRVAPTFTVGTAIKFVGAGMPARFSRFCTAVVGPLHYLRSDKIPAQAENGTNFSCGKAGASSSATK